MRALLLLTSVLASATAAWNTAGLNPSAVDFSGDETLATTDGTQQAPSTDGEAAAAMAAENTVASTEAAQCSTYLCRNSDHKSAATSYLKNGCVGSFDSFTSGYTDLQALEDRGAALPKGVTTPALLALSSACGLVALVAGFAAGRRERSALFQDDAERNPLLNHRTPSL